ncbi:MAG TPA: PepSY-associated TM helix domain-containing protein [Polyangiales bacterium]|nr:PepSY-associated TM helix domain-containing protein [Polyangiales bacterium]
MADGETSPPPRAAGQRSLPLRAALRALHRDAGYLAVGLTVVYALSGLAVNHIADWDPSFDNYEHTHQLHGPLAGDDATIAREVLTQLRIRETPRDVYRSTDDQLDITFDKRTLHVTPSSGQVLEQGQHERFFLRAANYLHLNRGKKAWTYVADTYAAALLFLALSGMFMIKGKKGLLGRGFVLVTLGAAVPVLYVLLS